ncbi:hypothetical protein CVT24_008528 [Panaeolus cyanescens]|uniref:HNH nuclease domain-containing protein n=1 Tax=Panaeolus cyanescens TaxID=181874 RepID=A0A409VKZ8_9AGAR|nr:hypothetical protein CVT24_008528 [Panaeolus cyanescens]
MDFVKAHLKPIAAGVEIRAQAVDPNNCRCLIENCSRSSGVDLVHVLHREAAGDPDQIASLEWAWNLPKNALHLDTRRNVFFCGLSLKQLYRENKWCLLPDPSDVKRYDGVILPHDRETFPVVEEKEFQYTFLPIQEMEDIYITRRTENPNGVPTVEVHHYPYADFPKITSHVHPIFAIAHLGTILSNSFFSPNIRRSLFKQYPILLDILALRNHWISGLPSRAANDPTYIRQQPSMGLDYHPNSRALDSETTSSNGTHTPQRRIWARPLTPETESSPVASNSLPSNGYSDIGSSSARSNTIPPRRIQPPRAAKTKAQEKQTWSHTTKNVSQQRLTRRALRCLKNKRNREEWTPRKIGKWAKNSKSSPSTVSPTPGPTMMKARRSRRRRG